MITINSKEELKELVKDWHMRPDWHEPDQQEVSASMYGRKFDNAGFYGMDATLTLPVDQVEQYVILYKDNKRVAQIALATLFAIACE